MELPRPAGFTRFHAPDGGVLWGGHEAWIYHLQPDQKASTCHLVTCSAQIQRHRGCHILQTHTRRPLYLVGPVMASRPPCRRLLQPGWIGRLPCTPWGAGHSSLGALRCLVSEARLDREGPPLHTQPSQFKVQTPVPHPRLRLCLVRLPGSWTLCRLCGGLSRRKCPNSEGFPLSLGRLFSANNRRLLNKDFLMIIIHFPVLTSCYYSLLFVIQRIAHLFGLRPNVCWVHCLAYIF